MSVFFTLFLATANATETDIETLPLEFKMTLETQHPVVLIWENKEIKPDPVKKDKKEEDTKPSLSLKNMPKFPVELYSEHPSKLLIQKTK
tara:strand:+ start:4771 stop:5040 length:270 start_codon:yes stop_codon:yes gene_type:complete